ncbi:hypothetical protein [Enterococcus asini]|uniref:hypothetical protein n=1 Tax=Enterococcus asini TaxID=57732 RepID=UPI0022E09EBC|nr:hypothetical protein [Enterococcus asini]
MKKQSLGDLNGYLFEQLERLNDPDLTDEELSRELKRAKAVTGVASQVVANAQVVLKAKMAYEENLERDAKKPDLLEG